MRKYLVLTMAVGALTALTVTGIATAETPVKVRAGNLELTFNGGFTPKALPKNKFAPINLNVSGKIRTVDGSHPPAMKEFILETDKNGMIDVKGLPKCSASKLQSRDTKAAESVCKTAIIGSGRAIASISFPEQNPIPADSKIIAFNGGFAGGTTTIYIHAYLTVPTPAAIVTTVKVKKNGFGLKSVATIPKIAGGNGSVTDFNLTINKKGVLGAKCPNGKIKAKGQAKFSDGTSARAEVIRTCTPKG